MDFLSLLDRNACSEERIIIHGYESLTFRESHRSMCCMEEDPPLTKVHVLCSKLMLNVTTNNGCKG